MTKREAAIVSAYTGVLLGDMETLHLYIESLFDRPVFMHELPELRDEIYRLSRRDFLDLVVE